MSGWWLFVLHAVSRAGDDAGPLISNGFEEELMLSRQHIPPVGGEEAADPDLGRVEHSPVINSDADVVRVLR